MISNIENECKKKIACATCEKWTQADYQIYTETERM